MSEMLTGDIVFDLPKSRSLAIKVIGVGGGGSNAVNYMFEQGITGVDFVICNTDSQALANSPVPTRIQLGQAITEGLGAGANPEVGEQAAIESIEEVKAVLDTGTKMVFVTAGMGGGTGTGAAPVIASIAKEIGILTVGIVTAPFYFEGKMRLEQAERGIEKLRNNVDSLIVINNDKLRELYGNLGYKSGFAKADEVLTTAAKGIAEVITHHYSTNIDLRDARTVLANSGTAIMGSAKGSGENKAKEAISAALDSPLLNNNKITGARNVLLLLLSGNNEITMDEIGIINDHIQNEAGNSANIIMGIGEDLELGDEISVTIVATGFPTEDQAYTGRDEQKIVHALEEEQPLNKTLSLDQPIPARVNPMSLNFGRNAQAPVEPEKEPEIKVEERYTAPRTDNSNTRSDYYEPYTPNRTYGSQEPIRHVLDDVEEPARENQTYDDFEPRMKTEPTPVAPTPSAPVSNNNQNSNNNNYNNGLPASFQTYASQESNDRGPKNEAIIQPKVEVTNSEVFNLNQINQSTQPAAHSTEMQTENTEAVVVNPLSQTIDQATNEELSNTVEDRRNRLRQFNFKFNNALTNNQVDEFEAIPAYKRQGLNLEDRQDNTSSDFNVSSTNNNDVQIRPNNFLHDNVD